MLKVGQRKAARHFSSPLRMVTKTLPLCCPSMERTQRWVVVRASCIITTSLGALSLSGMRVLHIHVRGCIIKCKSVCKCVDRIDLLLKNACTHNGWCSICQLHHLIASCSLDGTYVYIHMYVYIRIATLAVCIVQSKVHMYMCEALSRTSVCNVCCTVLCNVCCMYKCSACLIGFV